MKKKGFTLVELLVVIAIIGILVGMLLPAVQMVREAARRTSCSNNLHQLIIATHNYESSNQHFPPGWVGELGSDLAGWAWTSQILSFLDQQNLRDDIDFRSRIRDMPIAGTRTSTFKTVGCPSSPNRKDSIVQLPDSRNPTLDFAIGRSHYVGSVGVVPLEDMGDGEY